MASQNDQNKAKYERKLSNHDEPWRFVIGAVRVALTPHTPLSCDGPRGLFFYAAFGAGWPTFTAGAARACVARIDRRVAGEQQVCLRTTRWHAPTLEGESRMARAPP